MVSLLQILLLAQHVSGTTMPNIRSSRVLYRWLLPLCGMLQHTANRTQNPQLHTRPTTWKPKHQIPQAATTRIILLSSWWCAQWCPKHVEQAIAYRKPDTQPTAPHQTDNLKTKAPNTTGSNHLYNTLELLMMGTMVPETRWASNTICNKETICCI